VQRATVPAGVRDVFVGTAQTAFVDGIRVASIVGVVLGLAAALLTRRFLPRSVAPVGPMHSAVDALENAAELGIGGTMPVFADGDENDAQDDEHVGQHVEGGARVRSSA